MPFRSRYTGLIAKYHDRLPLADDVRIISLGEGNTPLIRLCNLPRRLGREVDIYVKYEGLNPTGSFKDRGMTVAVTQAVAEGCRAIVCASTGNTSASAAAYAARSGMRAFVLIPEGKIAMGKLAQAIIHGAEVLQIRGNFDVGMRIVRELAEEGPITLVNSVNPYRLQGQKTAAFEIIEELERVPEFHCLPVGNAGNITAHWIGYSELALGHNDQGTQACSFCAGRCRFTCAMVRERPRMIGYQAAGAAPFLRTQMIDNPETVATAIRIGHPQSWEQAWAASRESGGWFAELTDQEILSAQRLLAEQEGVFCEPASAASVAGCLRDVQTGKIPEGSTIVCTLTGHGLKDPDIASRDASAAVCTLDADVDLIKRAILDKLG